MKIHVQFLLLLFFAVSNQARAIECLSLSTFSKDVREVSYRTEKQIFSADREFGGYVRYDRTLADGIELPQSGDLFIEFTRFQGERRWDLQDTVRINLRSLRNRIWGLGQFIDKIWISNGQTILVVSTKTESFKKFGKSYPPLYRTYFINLWNQKVISLDEQVIGIDPRIPTGFLFFVTAHEVASPTGQKGTLVTRRGVSRFHRGGDEKTIYKYDSKYLGDGTSNAEAFSRDSHTITPPTISRSGKSMIGHSIAYERQTLIHYKDQDGSPREVLLK